MREVPSNGRDTSRPEFMVKLGMLPPYTHEDLKQAYIDKVKTAHPDHGGSREEFRAIHEAYEQAQAYLSFRSSRRRWIAAQIDGYVAHQETVEQLQQQGAEVETNLVEWMEGSFGDFAELTEAVVAVRLTDSAVADRVIESMVTRRGALERMRRLELPGCQVSDASILRLRFFQQLEFLDFRNTPVTNKALSVVGSLPLLETLLLEGTSIGWWSRRKVRSRLRWRTKRRPVKIRS